MPNFANGKICYLEIPATDVARSAEFYRAVFGWNVRRRGDGELAFADAVGEVSGTWVLGRMPARETGIITYVMVADAVKSVDAIRAAGGEIVKPIDPAQREVFAWFRDPAGNVLGINQQPGIARP
jgi:predicted enzyme related to lactoylglutathione lyase